MQIGIEDIKKAYTLFLDEHRSTQFVKEIQDEFMFNDEETESSNKLYCFRIYLTGTKTISF